MRPDPELVEEVPVGYVVTDLLWCDGRRVADLPYRERRRELEALGLGGPSILVPPSFSVDEADLVVRTAEQYGLDGLHLKRLDVPYQPGRRTRHWLRVPLRRRRQVLVCGWVPVSRDGTRAGWPRSGPDRIAAVLLGLPGTDGPVYVGRTGLGATHDRADVAALVAAPRTDVSPFRSRRPGRRRPSRPGGWSPAWSRSSRTGGGPRPGGSRCRRGWAWSTPTTSTRSWHGAAPPEPAVAGRRPTGRRPRRRSRSPPTGARAVARAAVPAPGAALRLQLAEHDRRAVRTDPPRARELLFGFADLSRAADRPGEPTIRLDEELDAVRGYLELEQARFGSRLRDVGAGRPTVSSRPPRCAPLAVLAAVREAVQQRIEPRPDGRCGDA